MIRFIKPVMLFRSRLKTDSSWFSLQTTVTWMWMKYWCHWTLLQPPATQPMALSVVKAAVWVNVNLILCSILVIALWCQQSRRTRLSSDVQADVALRHPDRLHRKSSQRLTGSLLASFFIDIPAKSAKKCQSPLLKKMITRRKMLEVSQSLFNFYCQNHSDYCVQKSVGVMDKKKKNLRRKIFYFAIWVEKKTKIQRINKVLRLGSSG